MHKLKLAASNQNVPDTGMLDDLDNLASIEHDLHSTGDVWGFEDSLGSHYAENPPEHQAGNAPTNAIDFLLKLLQTPSLVELKDTHSLHRLWQFFSNAPMWREAMLSICSRLR